MDHRNFIMLLGRAGNDPKEYEYGEMKIARFPLAVKVGDRPNDKVKNPKTSWFSVGAYNKVAEHALKNVRKGDLVRIIGWVDSYTKLVHGRQVLKLEVVADLIEIRQRSVKRAGLGGPFVEDATGADDFGDEY